MAALRAEPLPLLLNADSAVKALLAVRQRILDADPVIVTWWEVEPSATVRRTALRLLRVHPLRAADALQLAAALAAAHGNPSTLAFICGDTRLLAAADIEGFPVT